MYGRWIRVSSETGGLSNGGSGGMSAHVVHLDGDCVFSSPDEEKVEMFAAVLASKIRRDVATEKAEQGPAAEYYKEKLLRGRHGR